jgi:hypothetical protein
MVTATCRYTSATAGWTEHSPQLSIMTLWCMSHRRGSSSMWAVVVKQVWNGQSQTLACGIFFQPSGCAKLRGGFGFLWCMLDMEAPRKAAGRVINALGRWGTVAHTSNPSHLGGRDWEVWGLRPVPAITNAKRTGPRGSSGRVPA